MFNYYGEYPEKEVEGMETPVDVCSSAAGYYIGTAVFEEIFEGMGMWVPGRRVSREYYRSEKSAREALNAYSFSIRSYA